MSPRFLTAAESAKQLRLDAETVYALLREPEERKRLPRGVIWAVVVITIMPLLLILVGTDFASPVGSFDLPAAGVLGPADRVEVPARGLSGSFTHTILESIAFCAAIFTVILAWTHFAIRKGDLTAPVIGLALFCAGCMDAFHLLAANGLIDASVEITRLVPLTWALGRLFCALVMVVGALILLRGTPYVRTAPGWLVWTVSLGLAVMAYGTIHFCVASGNLPRAMYPESFVKRPFDVAPLVLFSIAGVFLFPRLCRSVPSFFSHALLVSMVPHIASQMHVTFGSAALFDSHFNVAHFLKIVAYLVPFAGLCMDYFHAHRSADQTIRAMKQTEETKDRLLYGTKKRVKELSCMYGVAKAIRERETLEEVFLEVAALVPAGWQYPKITRAKLQLDGREFVAEPFEETAWKQASNLRVGGQRHGAIEIYYLEERPLLDEGPFLTEERNLIEGIARALSEAVERKRSEESLKEHAISLETANNALTEAQGVAEEARQALEDSVGQLGQANRELARKNTELDQFSYVASHDLQEPLRKLTAFSSLLVQDLGGELPEQAAKDLSFITDAAERMKTLVQDLLRLSRAGRTAMRRERISLDDCVDRALEALAARIEETEAEITREDLPEIVGDATMLTQLYQNLIGNALKFVGCHQRPVVRLSAQRVAGEWEFGVWDNGIGIKPEYAEQIFEPFKQLHSRSEYQGSGIGLAICRKTVERHGGRIWVEPASGGGSQFKFTIAAKTEDQEWASETASQPSFC